jgi:peptidyl-prolyl cis-trans isomerase SurA
MRFKIIFFIGMFFFSSLLLAQEKSLDRVIAIVNSNVITNSELNQQMAIARSQMHAAGGPLLPENKLREVVLNRLIDNNLQFDIAKKANLKISDEQVNSAISKIAAQNNISVDDLRKSIGAEGLSYSEYREQIKNQILISEVQQHFVAPKVKVTAEDVREAKPISQPRVNINPNAQYHVIDILVSSDENAQDLLAKLKNSNDPDSILKNDSSLQINDLGLRPLSQLPDIFVKSVQVLKLGQFSNLLQAPNGVHILRLLEVRGNQAYSRAPALSSEQIAYQEKYNEALKNWLKTLRSQSYVKIND